MGQVLLTLLSLGLLFALLASGAWIAIALAGIGYVIIALSSSAPVGQVLASTIWGASYSWELAALPLFIWMGEILFRSRLSDDMFEGLAPWLNRIPGRLLHVNVFGCAIFAAVSGSSAATAATIGKIALPELKKQGYDERMSMGTLAGSGTLGLLIPPSIIMIVYGVAAGESVARLFIAGIVPGIVVAAMFAGYVIIWALRHPEKIPSAQASIGWRARIYQSRRLVPILLLIAGVIGSIYMGVASPTDAAAVGVVLSLILSARSGTLTWKTFVDGVMGATRTSCMIAFILLGAAFLTAAMGYAGIPNDLAAWIDSLRLSPYLLIAVLTVFFIILGCFLDGISIVVLTTAVILPMVERSGFDLIWFGIYLVIVVEMSAITPPVGFNLFVIQGLTGADLTEVARAALPFFWILVLSVAILVVFPGLATFLPNQMFTR